MGLRSALDQSWYVTVPVLAFLGWLLLRSLAVYDLLATAGAADAFVGTTAVSGVVGLVVIGVVVLLVVVLYSELGEQTPAPSPWPPEE